MNSNPKSQIPNLCIYSTNKINAMGLAGPEETPEAIKKFTNLPIQHIQVNNDDIQESQETLYQEAKKIFSSQNHERSEPLSAKRSVSEAVCQRSGLSAKRSQNDIRLFIGGDHSITYPILKAFQEKNKNPFLIVFDAHADCDIPTQEPTHEEWLRKTIEDGFDPTKIILIGTRKMWKTEKEFLEKHGVKIFQTIYNMEGAADYITEKALGHEVYISIDIDAIDPSQAPAVNYPEPNGLTSKEFFYIFNRLLKIKTLKTIDITEIIPEKDKAFDNRTLRLATKIIKEAIN